MTYFAKGYAADYYEHGQERQFRASVQDGPVPGERGHVH